MSEKSLGLTVLSGMRRLPLFPVLLLMPIVLFGLFAPLFYTHDPAAMNPTVSLQPPFLFGGDVKYFLGTDHLGRDVFSKIVAGARASLIAATAGVFIAGIVGIFLGMVAGYFGGWRGFEWPGSAEISRSSSSGCRVDGYHHACDGWSGIDPPN